MTKQLKNKSSKKNTFTGRRTIGNNKSKYVGDDFSNSDGNTSDEMRNILNSDNGSQVSMMNMQQPNQIASLLGNQMSQMPMPQMPMPQMSMPQMSMPQMPMPQMSMPQMQMMGQNNINDIDPDMVHNIVPVNNNMRMGNMQHLLEPEQMAQSLGNLAKLNNVPSYGGNMVNSEMSINNGQMPMMANQLNQMNMMGQPSVQSALSNMGSLKNLASLHNVPSI
jgi:hypothetical protein